MNWYWCESCKDHRGRKMVTYQGRTILVCNPCFKIIREQKTRLATKGGD